jgi:hypothetical protein
MTQPNNLLEEIDWSLTTWEGARREQLRRWAALPLESVVSALEEMETLTQQFAFADLRSI